MLFNFKIFYFERFQESTGQRRKIALEDTQKAFFPHPLVQSLIKEDVSAKLRYAKQRKHLPRLSPTESFIY